MTKSNSETHAEQPLNEHEITVETLKQWQNERILYDIQVWREMKARTKYPRSFQLIKAIQDAMKLDPDVVEIEFIREAYYQLVKERDLARRIIRGASTTDITPYASTANA